MSASGAPVSLPDADARRQAATEFDRNLVVVAGAGTGKTALLVERLLFAIGSGVADLSRIAALTFTEKAAGEMRERLAQGLEELRAAAARNAGDAEDPEGRRAASRAWRHLVQRGDAAPAEIESRALSALGGLDQAPVVTIHTFCAQILRAWPMGARVDPGFTVDPGEEQDALLDEEWERFLGNELGPEAPRGELWKRLLARLSEPDLRSIAHGLARFGVPAAAADPVACTGGARLLLPVALDLAGRLGALLAREPGLARWKTEYLSAVRDAFGELERGVEAFAAYVGARPDVAERWTGPNLPKADGTLRNTDRREFDRLSKEAHVLGQSLLRVDEALLREAVEAVAPFCRDVRETFLTRGFVSFDALLSLVRDLLRDDRAAREALQRRYRMILVDEFQDTDPLQYEIVLFLGERPGSFARSAYEADLDPGRLFVVGDPKQSIYRFRGADYAAFRRATARIVSCGGRELELTANFRSVEGVIAPVNALFDGARPGAWVERAPYQPGYLPIAAARPDRGDAPAVELWTIEGTTNGAPLRADARRALEAEVLAREMVRLVEEERACEYGEVTVLFRSFSSLGRYLRALREAGVPFVVAGGRDFLLRPEVSHLLSVLRAIARPSDPIALLAYLRSPAGGVPDGELAEFAESGGSWEAGAVPDAARCPTLAAALARLRRLADETHDLPAGLVVGHALRATGLLTLGAVAFEGPQRVANLRKLAAAAAAIAADGRRSLSEVLDAIEEERTSALEADSPLADAGSRAVRIFTVHAAKGLENRVVFVADLAREPARAGEAKSVLAVTPDDGAPLAAISAGGACTAARVFLDGENQRHEEAEETRVLYVALTRASDRLVLLCASPHGGRKLGPWLQALAPWGYDAASPPADGETLLDGRVLHRRMGGAARAREAVAPEAVDVAGAEAAYRRALEAMRAAAVPPLGRPSGPDDAPPPRDGASELPGGADRSIARAAGTVVHRFLERWDGSTAPGALSPLPALARAAAAELGCDAAEVGREAAELLRTFLEGPVAERFRTVRVIGREVPVLAADAAGAWRGAVDLVYRDENDRVVVADYKTDRELDEASLARYRAQLGVYREAVRRALRLGALPDGELWLLRSGRIVPV